ncbi:YheC/YheD family protein [Paenibacillus sp. PR3]|uniref:YheC/YheD family protein n=1 Tax=Paenibacillus terricola TaxID=2763503 RepID=A0ABR8N147_9BACL|nr:YheC/YheD family protein [Paenibacillus terricola]MBD3921909.1 YheC/YheD family protein [Paenibacillus terricola]
MGYRSTSIKSKWVKTKWLLASNTTRRYVPKTRLFNRSNLSSMISQYSTVYFKPTGGTGGQNIIRIRRQGSGYQAHYNYSKSKLSSLDSLYKHLRRHSRGRSYLLQRGIKLATCEGRSFDIRVVVQKSKRGPWKSTALLMKIGKRGKVTTNYHQGGKLGGFRSTLASAGYGKTVINRKEAQLKRLGRSVGKVFSRRVGGFHELGLDVALDNKRRIWIIEVNTRPHFTAIKHSNRSMHRRVMYYAKKYGRKK